MLVTRFNKKFLQAKIFSFKRLGQVQRTLTHSRSSVGPLAPPTCGAEVALPSDAKPIASASLAQVHRATRRGTGEPLAVKVQHAGMLEDTSPAGWEAWRNGMDRLAAMSNVVSKLSAFGTFIHRNDPDHVAALVRETVARFVESGCI